MQGNGALNCVLFSIPQASCKLFHENLKGWRKKDAKANYFRVWSQKPSNPKNDITQLFAIGSIKKQL